MSNYGALKSRVADELWQRTDLDSQIAAAILRAIEHYATTRFWFNEGTGTVNTVSGNQYVTLPSGLRTEDKVFATVGGNHYELCKREFDELEVWYGASDTSGQPMDYAIRDGQARIFPKPNAAYTITFTGIFDQTALSDDSDTNDWCTGIAQDLIVSRAKFTITRDILLDDKQMAMSRMAEMEALNRLRSETHMRVADGRVTAGW